MRNETRPSAVMQSKLGKAQGYRPHTGQNTLKLSSLDAFTRP